MYKSLPTIMELRPLPMAAKIFTDQSYKELGDALRDRLEIETDCLNRYCGYSEIGPKSEKFDNLFKGYFPSLLDSECEYEYGRSDILNRKCFTYIYNVGDCPTIITKSVNPSLNKISNNFYCNKFGKEYYYQGECNDAKRNCLDEMYYSDKCPNVYNNKNAVRFLIERFNTKFSEKYDKIDERYFDS